MLKNTFTVDEKYMIRIYNNDNRTAFIGKLSEAMPYIEEPEIKEIIESIIIKLNQMTDSEYKYHYLNMDFDLDGMLDELLNSDIFDDDDYETLDDDTLDIFNDELSNDTEV